MHNLAQAIRWWPAARQPGDGVAADGNAPQRTAAFERFVLNGRIRNFSIAGVHIHVDPALTTGWAPCCRTQR